MTLTQVTTGGVDENINIDSNTLKVDGTNNRVGIGTAGPSTPLHVKGGGDCYVTLEAGTADGNAGLLIDNSSGTQKGYILYDTDDNHLRFGTSNSERLKIDANGNVQVSVGQFTVGTTVSTGLQFISDGTFGTLQSAPLKFRTNSAQRMVIDTSGRVGINVTDPSSFFSGADQLVVSGGSGDGGITIDSGTSSIGRLLFADGTSGADQYRGYISYSHATNKLAIGSDGSERLCVDSSGQIGIGHSTPGALLHVKASGAQIKVSKGSGGGAAPSSPSRANCYIHVGGTEWGSTADNGHYLIGFGYTNGETGTGIPAYIGYREVSTGSYTKGDLIFGTRSSISGSDNPTERVRISSDGVLGINKSSGYTTGGFASPQISIKQTGTDWTGGIHIESQGSSKLGCIANTETGLEISQSYRHTSSGGAYRPIIFRTAGNEQMRITQTGKAIFGGTSGTAARWNFYDTTSSGMAWLYNTTNGNYRRAYLWGNNTTMGLYFTNGINEAALSSSGSWNNASDARIKKDIEPISYGLAEVMASQPRRYRMRSNDQNCIGFVAQEMREIVPEVVSGGESEDRMYGMDYGSLVAVAFKAIQEQQATIVALQNRVAALEAAA